jgi:hypothetical protein
LRVKFGKAWCFPIEERGWIGFGHFRAQPDVINL